MTAGAQLALPAWVCSKCASPGGEPQPGFLQMDPRYATGYCNTCTDPNPKKPRKTPRPVSRLVRGDVFDRDRWQEKVEKEQLRVLVQEFARGKDHVQMLEQDVVRLVTLYDKHGVPGFHLPESTRDAVTKYTEAEAKRAGYRKPTKPKRGRGA